MSVLTFTADAVTDRTAPPRPTTAFTWIGGGLTMPRTWYVFEESHDCQAGMHTTKYGDLICQGCGTVLSWSPHLVRDGVFGEETARWTQHEEWRMQATEPGVDAWGMALKQPADGHSAWSCNNYGCTRHPASMYPTFGWSVDRAMTPQEQEAAAENLGAQSEEQDA